MVKGKIDDYSNDHNDHFKSRIEAKIKYYLVNFKSPVGAVRI